MTIIEIILLCLLQDKDYYGYEMEEVIDKRNMRMWASIGFSSIYNSLNRLEKAEYISSRMEKKYGSPKRKVYFSNESSKAVVKEEVIKLIAKSKNDSSSFDVGIAFSYLLAKEEFLKALLEHKENLIKRKKLLEYRYGIHPTAKERPYIKALFERPLLFVETEYKWLEDFINTNF